MYEEFPHTTQEKKQTLKWANTWNSTLQKKTAKSPIYAWKDAQTIVITGEIQIKITLQYHCTYTKWLKFKLMLIISTLDMSMEQLELSYINDEV